MATILFRVHNLLSKINGKFVATMMYIAEFSVAVFLAVFCDLSLHLLWFS